MTLDLVANRIFSGLLQVGITTGNGSVTYVIVSYFGRNFYIQNVTPELPSVSATISNNTLSVVSQYAAFINLIRTNF